MRLLSISGDILLYGGCALALILFVALFGV